MELENGWQIPLLFLLYFVAKNKNQPQRTVDDRSERFGGFWGEAFGHRRQPLFLGTGPTIANKIKGLTGSVPNFRALTESRP